MDLEISTIWFWILLGVTGIISGVIGYLFGKVNVGSENDNSFQINLLEIQNAKLKADLDTCKKRLSTTKPPKLNVDSPPLPISKLAPRFHAGEAKMAFGKNIKEDDLKIVEGIGPKIEELFHNFDIKTWKALSETSADTCQEVLNSGGKRYRIHDPASWPMQAKMAYEGHWKQLAEWQEKHRAGKY
ncbi:hypothetical protein [Flagellimonas amoyensis]|uniref:hypothetical protein n=1 Tax=Flagellimonas amoyensis TaxID=2169401 RepID=UPI001900433C|nr:hypothetical protein [Allomuricauda amoyensis]